MMQHLSWSQSAAYIAAAVVAVAATEPVTSGTAAAVVAVAEAETDPVPSIHQYCTTTCNKS